MKDLKDVFPVAVISLLAPGQGSQTPGMLTPWLALPGAADRVALWSKISGLDLERLGTTADAQEISDTAVTQPLIVASSLLAFEEMDRRGLLPESFVVAGHSIGEFTAAAVAGVISSDDAVALAALRGAEMAKACAITPTGMSAVLGGSEDDVLTRLEELGLEPANRNAVGQIVAAGPIEALEELAAAPPEKARIRPLSVAGAFHTRFMEPARAAVAGAVDSIIPMEPTQVLLSNRDGRPVASGRDALDRLADQITRSVRWDRCTEYLTTAGVTGLAELAPGGTLTGIAKREMRGVPAVAIKTPEDVEKVADLA